MTFRLRDRTLHSVGLLCLMISLASLGGCASRKPPPRLPEDRQLERLNRTARAAFQQGNYSSAADLYRSALDRALLRDDFSAITDARYNLAVSLLKQEDIAGAASQLRAVESEYFRAGREVPPEVTLLEATILYRSGEPDRAWAVTTEILAAADRTSPDVLGRTHYLRGRIAAERGDSEGLRAAIDAMGQPADPQLIADSEELKGRLAFSEQRWEEAVAAFDRAASLQRHLLNYRAMAEALALGAEACERGQRPGLAAARYLEAGRSAALRGDVDSARLWLTEAADLAERAGDENTAREAGQILSGLEETS